MKLGEHSFARIVDDLHDGLYLVDRNRIVTYWNKAAERLSGFSAEEVLGRSCSDGILTHVDGDGNPLCDFGCPLAATLHDQRPRQVQVYMHHKDGHRVPVSVRSSVITNDAGEVEGVAELFTDIGGQAANELRVRELEKMAFLDPLTQLANRNYIERELGGRLEEKKRYGTPFGLLFLDIDHFKAVNDTYGHDAGDEVLKFVANTLTASSRPFDLFGRWGGEEFLGIIRNIEVPDLARLGERVRALVESAYIDRGGERIQVTISIGATGCRDDDTLETIVKRADELLYRSKRSGRNRLSLG